MSSFLQNIATRANVSSDQHRDDLRFRHTPHENDQLRPESLCPGAVRHPSCLRFSPYPSLWYSDTVEPPHLLLRYRGPLAIQEHRRVTPSSEANTSDRHTHGRTPSMRTIATKQRRLKIARSILKRRAYMALAGGRSQQDMPVNRQAPTDASIFSGRKDPYKQHVQAHERELSEIHRTSGL